MKVLAELILNIKILEFDLRKVAVQEIFKIWRFSKNQEPFYV